MKYTINETEGKHYLDKREIEIGSTFILLKERYSNEVELYYSIVSGFADDEGLGVMILTCINEKGEVLYLAFEEAKYSGSYKLLDEINDGFNFNQEQMIQRLETIVNTAKNEYMELKRKLEFIKKYINLGD